MSEKLEIIFEVLKIVSPFIALLLTWIVGTGVLQEAELRKKKKELDLSISSEFYRLYGEFSAVWRLWKAHHDKFKDKNLLVATSLENYWELLKRAANVEGGMESIYVKIASEKTLTPHEIKSIGLFRQAIQQLRQSIREYEVMDWQRSHSEYILLKELSVFTARLINLERDYPEKEAAAVRQLTDITAIDSATWKREVGTATSYYHEHLKGRDTPNDRR